MKPSASKGSFSPHGTGLRGADVARRSSLFEGRFGRIFRELPPARHSQEQLLALGAAMTADAEGADDEPPRPKAAPETADHIQDDEENSGIQAGYTYLGQFIDHDITFDPASSLMQQNDPDSLVDFRTPRLDLDSVYGRGPADQPYVFVGKKFRLGSKLFELDQSSPSRDLPRYDDPENPSEPARALIGDKRNDENVIISQLHGVFLQLHNRLVDEFPQATFEETQRLVRWHYQWVVLNDFLPKICGTKLIDEILPNRLITAPAATKKPRLQYFHWRNEPFMPLEFAVAAYRFGHSMVRPVYRLNTRLNGGDDPNNATQDEIDRGLAGRFFIFAGVSGRGLNGFGRFPEQWAIDWSLFFDVNGSGQLGGKKRAQPAYKIDTSLVNPLGFLPEFSHVANPNPPLTLEQLQAVAVDPKNDPANLAARNLLRGLSLRLPSGQAVARAMGVEVVQTADLKLGKAIVDDMANARTIIDIDPDFEDNAPLWYYILAETQHEWFKRATGPGGQGDNEPLWLGSVGGRIVAETLIGLVYGDGHSYLVQDPNWEPSISGRTLTMGKLVQYALTGAL